MPKPRFLSVVVNKYLAHDSEGRPCALAYRVDTVKPEPIGATLVPPAKEGDELVYTYSDEPVTIADDPTHRRLLKSRQLLPADEATARLVGVDYLPVSEALEAARKAAVQRYADETNGEESEHLRAPLPPPKAPVESALPPVLASGLSAPPKATTKTGKES